MASETTRKDSKLPLANHASATPARAHPEVDSVVHVTRWSNCNVCALCIVAGEMYIVRLASYALPAMRREPVWPQADPVTLPTRRKEVTIKKIVKKKC